MNSIKILGSDQNEHSLSRHFEPQIIATSHQKHRNISNLSPDELGQDKYETIVNIGIDKQEGFVGSREGRDPEHILIGGYIDSKEFEDIAEIYDQIRQWNAQNDKPKVDDLKLAGMFDVELQQVMQQISTACQLVDRDKAALGSATSERGSQTGCSAIDDAFASIIDTRKHQKCVEGLHQLYRLCERSLIQTLQPNSIKQSSDLKIILSNIFTGTSLLMDKYNTII